MIIYSRGDTSRQLTTSGVCKWAGCVERTFSGRRDWDIRLWKQGCDCCNVDERVVLKIYLCHAIQLCDTLVVCIFVRSVLLGVASNCAVKDVDLNLSGNALGLGAAGSQMLEDCLPTAAHISSLDLSDNSNTFYIIFVIDYLYSFLLP